MKKEIMKKHLYACLTVMLLWPFLAAAGTAQQTLLVAESELFEIVGRMAENGLVFHVDRSSDNRPVLAARLSVESEGHELVARFRPERGDYVIDDETWLKPLREQGEHAMTFTLLVDDESDLLAATLMVSSLPEQSTGATDASPQRSMGWLILPLLGGALVWFLLRKRKDGVA